MTSQADPVAMTGELEVVKAELKALKELVSKLQARLEQIEDELTAIRNMI